MKCLYQPVSYDVDSDEKHEPIRLILSNNDVTSLLISLMTKYLSNHNDLTAIDILKEKSYLGKIFKNCCVCEIVSSIYDFEEFENVAFPVVVKWFAGKNVKPSANDYTRAMDSMFMRMIYCLMETVTIMNIWLTDMITSKMHILARMIIGLISSKVDALMLIDLSTMTNSHSD